MANEAFGKALSEARNARGLTLHDVERDTRISQKYLKALEEGDLTVLPAPVYARAFTRTYAQYLGLNAPAMVQQLPGAKPEAELPPLPAVGHDVTRALLTPSWMVAGVVVAILFFAGLAIFWNRGGDEGNENVARPAGQGAEQVTPPVTQPSPTVAVQEGVVPDIQNANVLDALQALSTAGLPYLIIEVEKNDAEEAHVFNQSPSPGTEASQDTVVTLMVAR
jgi:cytoskeletal protein RodZ